MKLWEPTKEQIANANVTRFIADLSKRYGLSFSNYQSFQSWTTDNIGEFWESVWEFCQVRASVKYNKIVEGNHFGPGVAWFRGAKLNFSENLLRFNDSSPAIVYWNENGRQESFTYSQLNQQVKSLYFSLTSLKLTSADRVAALLPNIPHAIFGMLATTAMGASWSSCSPDFSVQGILDRFSQIKPKVLFCCDSYLYKGERISLKDKIQKLASNLTSLEQIVIIPYFNDCQEIESISRGVSYDNFVAASLKIDQPIIFEQVSPEHPVYILFSSGTTGAPKCIVHSVSGILLEHLKELTLEVDLRREDKIFYNTTCGWMMWNWLASSLALGSTILLYDGFPLARDGQILFDLVEEEKMTVFGTSAGYLQKIEELGLNPVSTHDLSSLRSILSTGSRLKPHSFDYVYRSFGKVQLSPIWGGTDLCGCLGTASPVLPVYRDELQTRGLGLAVDVVDHQGNTIKGEAGEVVVRKPFPSVPVGFLNDSDNRRFKSSYFERFPGMWHHGDWAILKDSGGMTILGRSDDTLNPGGIRIGSAEITTAAERVPGVLEAMAVAQQWKDDERIVLFVILSEGVVLSDTIKKAISNEMPSPRHRPKKIISVQDLPTTLNGKRSARAVRDVIHGRQVPNSEALINPHVLDQFRNIDELNQD